MVKEEDQFDINSSNETFNARRKNVFDQLTQIKTTIGENTLQNDEDHIDNTTKIIHTRYDMEEFRGKKSIFKMPNRPIQKCLPKSNVPDHQKNPQKWTKYSLNDVTEADMSERSNTAAAMSFLREMEDRKCAEQNDAEEDGQKITFRKSATLKEKLERKDSEEGSSYRNSKVVMPEYIVGQKVKKDKKKKLKRSPDFGSKQLKLDHLLDEENEDD